MRRPKLIPPRLLRENANFRRYYVGQSVSLLGDQIAGIALPLTAILTLDAGPGQVAALGVAFLIPNLLFALHAGVWIDRRGTPHTDALHLIERITRVDYNTLKYEATIDDPKAYTKQWTGGHLIYWTPDEDFEEYFCQGNNRDADHLVGQ